MEPPAATARGLLPPSTPPPASPLDLAKLDPADADEGGFVLFGIILVAGVLSLGIGLGLTLYQKVLTGEFLAETNREMVFLNDAFYSYYRDLGEFPGQLEDLLAKPEGAVGWMGPYVPLTFQDYTDADLTLLRDAWGTRYTYAPVGTQGVILRSRGPNRVNDLGTGDDLRTAVDIHPIAWAETKSELRILRNAINAYNHYPTVPAWLPADWQLAVAILQSEGFLPPGDEFAAELLSDGWDQTYVPIGAPITSVTGGPEDLVTICHVPGGDPEKARTLQVQPDRVATHLAHGDYLGVCVVGDNYDGLPDEEEAGGQE